MDQYYAHTLEGYSEEYWHKLEDHLYAVAQMAGEFAAEFGAGEWGYLAGLWHDLGKYSGEFQEYLSKVTNTDAHIETKPGRVDHSTAGALALEERFNLLGRILSYVVAGHHSGLADWQSESAGMSALSQRLNNKELWTKVREVVPPAILNQPLPEEKPATNADPALWIRMLFSCVADADFLDTEGFMDSTRAKKRGGFKSLRDLFPPFEQYMAKKEAEVEKTAVNRTRADILRQCREKAKNPPGLFTLTVPTGGGKTLSSMAFALNHALKHGKQRIIYVIPYTSIIEQTADQFRLIFGDEIIEHHSNLDVHNEKDETSSTRLACENWDAPIIVTTAVQFFESLFATRTSRCRKLHNIVNSVIILDEAQLLPPEYLYPICSVLQELHRNYRVTFLLSTATQPALGARPDFAGLEDVTEIIADPENLHKRLERVEVIKRKEENTPVSWKELAQEMINHQTVLCIVNRRDDCRELFQEMPEGTIHLSALMCGAHRSKVIAEIKRRLKEHIPTRVISTQLVEAGVDLDFPVVYRAMAGLDSIAQAAGRCNREGRLAKKGKVVVFTTPSLPPRGHLRQAAELGRQFIEDIQGNITLEQFNEYFKQLYWIKGKDLDKHGILDDLKARGALEIKFRTAAMNFQIINDAAQRSVLVKYEEGAKLIEQLRTKGPERWLKRRAQRYVVNVPVYVHEKLMKEGVISEIHPGLYAQGPDALYHPQLGFSPGKTYEPDELII